MDYVYDDRWSICIVKIEKAPASGYSASRWTGEDSQETNEGRGQTMTSGHQRRSAAFISY